MTETLWLQTDRMVNHISFAEVVFAHAYILKYNKKRYIDVWSYFPFWSPVTRAASVSSAVSVDFCPFGARAAHASAAAA